MMRSVILSKLRTHAPVAEKQPASNGEDKEVGGSPQDEGIASDGESLSPDAQDGVRKIEATTQVWSRKHLIFAYVMYVILPAPDVVFPNTSVHGRSLLGQG